VSPPPRVRPCRRHNLQPCRPTYSCALTRPKGTTNTVWRPWPVGGARVAGWWRPLAMAAGPTTGLGGRWWRPSANMPALGMAARACRIWPRRHVTRVAWPDVPPLRCGPFWQIFS
jgi:hypothetical protein